MTTPTEVDSSTPSKTALLEMRAFTNPRQAQAVGIATIYQELNQVTHLSITENIFLGSEITRRPRPTGLNLKPTPLERTKKAAMFKYYCPGQLCNLKRSCYRD